MEKLLTPIARTLPVSRSFSISAQAWLKLTLSVVLKEPSGFRGRGFPSNVGSRSQLNSRTVYEGRKKVVGGREKNEDTFVSYGLWPVHQVLFTEY